jgi:hypothetical protein
VIRGEDHRSASSTVVNRSFTTVDPLGRTSKTVVQQNIAASAVTQPTELTDGISTLDQIAAQGVAASEPERSTAPFSTAQNR